VSNRPRAAESGPDWQKAAVSFQDGGGSWQVAAELSGMAIEVGKFFGKTAGS
jgi:hypothetical protein